MSSIPANADPYRVAVAHAAELVGGVYALSQRLQVPLADMIRWLDGINRPPVEIIVRVMDVLNEEKRARIAQEKRVSD